MNVATLLAVVIILLLGVDWRYRRPSIRIAVTLLTLLMLLVAQPTLYRAFRRAALAAPAERTDSIPSRKLSEYETGVYTMKQAFDEEIEDESTHRMIAVAVLAWLAASPVLQRRRSSSPTPATSNRDA